MVMEDDSGSRGCGFESWRLILDGHDIYHIELLQKLYCLFGMTKNKRKKSPWLAHIFLKNRYIF